MKRASGKEIAESSQKKPRTIKYLEVALENEKVESKMWKDLCDGLLSVKFMSVKEEAPSSFITLMMLNHIQVLEGKLKVTMDLKQKDAAEIRKLNDKVRDMETENKKQLTAHVLLSASESKNSQLSNTICKLEMTCKQLNEEMNKKLELVAELHDAHTELISGMSDILSGRNDSFTVKKMGELDVDTFLDFCKLRYPPEQAETHALHLRSLCQDQLLNNPLFNPFKITVDSDGNTQKGLDEGNGTLQFLKEKSGNETYNVVTKALKDIYEYNPIGRQPVPMLWNNKEDRRATAGEVIRYMFSELEKLNSSAEYLEFSV